MKFQIAWPLSCAASSFRVCMGIIVKHCPRVMIEENVLHHSQDSQPENGSTEISHLLHVEDPTAADKDPYDITEKTEMGQMAVSLSLSFYCHSILSGILGCSATAIVKLVFSPIL